MPNCEITYRDVSNRLNRCTLAEATSLPVETFQPIRVLRPGRKNQSIHGLYLFSKTGVSLVYESRLELFNLILLDFDRRVEAVATQPFCLHIEGHRGRYPDVFARMTDGSGSVYDVKPRSKLDNEKVKASFERTRKAVESVGWRYGVVSELPSPLLANLLFLHGFRFAPVDKWGIYEALLNRAVEPQTIHALASSVEPQVFARPVLFHLLWHGRLLTELDEEVLSDSSVVVNPAAPQ